LGAHGTGIFDDDVTLDIRDAIDEALLNGLDIDVATQGVLRKYQMRLEDDDDRPLVWLALAVIQLEHGALQSEVRRQAMIAVDENLGRWEEAGEDLLGERRQVLERLKDRMSTAAVSDEV